MSVVTTSILAWPEGGYLDPKVSAQLHQFDVDYWPPYVSDFSPIVSGAFQNNLPVTQVGRNFSAQIIHDTFYDYYFHVRTIPSVLDLGNLATTQTRDVELWNSYLEDVTVTSIDLINGQGLSIQAPAGYTDPPFVLRPTQSLVYKLTSDLNGQPTINATLVFHTDHGDASVKIIGTRLVLFPFKPDWANGIQETVSARSVIARAYDGTEQSVSYRRRFRRSFSVPYTLKGADAQRFDNLLFGWQSRMYGMPCWTEEAEVSSAIATGDQTLQADTSDRTFIVGGTIMVYNDRDPSVYETKEIQAVSPLSMVVSSPFANNWSPGSKIVPVFTSTVSPSVSGSRPTSEVLQATLNFDCEPSTTDPNTPDTNPPVVYKGYEVYSKEPNWRDGNSFLFNTDGKRIDLNTGVFSLKTLADYSSVGRGHAWYLKSHADMAAFRAWLLRRQGKTFGCWMPSGMKDFDCVSPIITSAATISCKPNGYTQMAAGNAARNHLYLKLRSGQEFFREIVNSTDQNDGTMALEVDSPFGVNIAVKDIVYLSVLNFYRLSQDDIDITWYVPGKAESVTGLLSTRSYT